MDRVINVSIWEAIIDILINKGLLGKLANDIEVGSQELFKSAEGHITWMPLAALLRDA